MTPRAAIAMARERDADLVEIVPGATPPVCKIINFGKFKYELAKKDKIQKKHQHVSLLKELRFHPNTDVHDFDFKAKQGKKFLEKGDKVKASMRLIGRENIFTDRAREVLNRFCETIGGEFESPPSKVGNQLTSIHKVKKI